jgi:GntR family transcriptional repressor for pyruvate dehydrogenase complex
LFKRVPKERLYEGIVDQVMRSILSGELRSGDQLPTEAELVQQFGVSRTVVREATKALSSAGLVDVWPKRGTFITQPPIETVVNSRQLMYKLDDHQTLDSVIVVRRLLEVPAARLAAENAQPTNLEALAAYLRGMRSSVNDQKAFMSYDTAFHSELARATQNGLLSLLCQATLGMIIKPIFRMVEAGHETADLFPNMTERALRFHEGIYQAIVEKDGNAAEESMRHHLADVAGNLAYAREQGVLDDTDL